MMVEAVVNNGRFPYSYSWNDGLNSYTGNPFIFPSENPVAAILNLVVTDYCNNQEIGSVAVEVLACAVTIPNVITPNGDGMNDLLVFENLGLMDIF